MQETNDKLQQLRNKIEDISQKHKLSPEQREEKIYQHLINNNYLITKENITTFTRDKQITQNILNRLNSNFKSIMVLFFEDNILKVGIKENFSGNAFFSKKLDRSFFYTPNQMDTIFINPTCIHPAKKEEAILILTNLISHSEYSCLSELTSFFE